MHSIRTVECIASMLADPFKFPSSLLLVQLIRSYSRLAWERVFMFCPTIPHTKYTRTETRRARKTKKISWQ